MSEDEGRVVARIQIERLIMGNGNDRVLFQFDDGTDDGDMPTTVELLGMLSLAKDTVLHGELYSCDDEGDDD